MSDDLSKLLKALKDLIESADRHRAGTGLVILGGIIFVFGLWAARN